MKRAIFRSFFFAHSLSKRNDENKTLITSDSTSPVERSINRSDKWLVHQNKTRVKAEGSKKCLENERGEQYVSRLVALVQNRLYDRRGTLICSRIKSIPFCVVHCIVPFFRRVCYMFLIFSLIDVHTSQKFENHRCVSWNVRIEKKKKIVKLEFHQNHKMCVSSHSLF